MSRIAIFSDVHGNAPALDAVLRDIDSQGVDEVLVGGDLVGRGPEGSKVIDHIRRRGLRSVRGNHEDYLVTYRHRDSKNADFSAPHWACLRWMAEELTTEDISYISALPFTLQSTVDPQVCVFHGTPESNARGIGPWTAEEKIRHHLERLEGKVLVCAHTHRSFGFSWNGKHLINTGSVGLPFNGDPRAQYVIVTGSDGQYDVEFRKVEYSREKLLSIYQESGFLEAGDVTARLLELEVVHARPFLVPFLKWCQNEDLQPLLETVPLFVERYDAVTGVMSSTEDPSAITDP
jgi:predicted phosphodiesterase